LCSLALILVLTITGYAVFRPKPPEPPNSVSSIDDVESYLKGLVSFGVPPGLTVVVVKDNEIKYNEGFGLADTPKNVKAAPGTVYKWWSMTKVFTAVAILQLHDQKKLDIDDQVSHHLAFFDVNYPSESDEKITIRHLLNHSSGIPDNVPEVMGWMHLADEPQPNNTTFLESVFSDYAELNFAPGTRSEYSNVGYMVLGAIIEKVTERTYEEYVAENILSRLEMDHTNFIYTDAMREVAATGSHPLISWQTPFLPFLFDDWRAFIRETVDRRMWFNRFYADSNPPTGLIGSTADLANFLRACLNEGKYDGNRILSKETMALMLTEGIIHAEDTGQTDEPFQGLGWEVNKSGDKVHYLAHGGGGPGFGCAMRIYPERDLGIAVLANDTTYDSGVILDLIAQLEW
jgi:CubicO group peptidase (beta-lactamase class C family)